MKEYIWVRIQMTLSSTGACRPVIYQGGFMEYSKAWRGVLSFLKTAYNCFTGRREMKVIEENQVQKELQLLQQQLGEARKFYREWKREVKDEESRFRAVESDIEGQIVLKQKLLEGISKNQPINEMVETPSRKINTDMRYKMRDILSKVRVVCEV